jgi:hypothetical protein
MWFPRSDKIIQILNMAKVNYEYRFFSDIIHFDHKLIVYDKPIIFTLMEDLDIAQFFDSDIDFIDYGRVIGFLIDNNFNRNILPAILSVTKLETIYYAATYLDYENMDTEMAHILVQHLKKLSDVEKLRIGLYFIRQSDNYPVFKIFMDKFNLTCYCLGNLFQEAITNLRTDITEYLITAHKQHPTICANDINRLVRDNIDDHTIQFLNMLIKLYDSGYIQDFDWTDIIKLVDEKYPFGSINWLSIKN